MSDRSDAGASRCGEVLTYLPDVDAAWPAILAAARRLCEDLSTTRGASRSEPVFEDLVDQLVAIFRREESMLKTTEGRDLDIHRRGHFAILKILAELRAASRESGGSPALGSRARRDLLGTLEEHHVVLDALLGRHVREWSRTPHPDDDPFPLSDDSEP